MWYFEISTGVITHDEEHVGVGYSGFAEGKNNASLQNVHNVGPIPEGVYRIGPAFDSDHLGPHVMKLTPLAGVDVYGRDGFYWHGDDKQHPGTGSHGCVVSSRVIRDQVSESLTHGDDLLSVTAGRPEIGLV